MHLVTLQSELNAIVTASIKRLRSREGGEEREQIAQKLEALDPENLTNEAYRNCYPPNPHHQNQIDYSPECSECHQKHAAVVKIGPDYDEGDYGQGAVDEVWVCRACLTAALALFPSDHH